MYARVEAALHMRCALDRLRALNAAVALLFAGTTAWLLVASATEGPVLAVHAVWWHRGESAPRIHTWHARVMYLCAAFTALASLDHVCVATCLRGAYERQLTRERNAFRWAEYAASASIMNVLIALECGVLDVLLLACVAALTAACMCFGWLSEAHDSRAAFLLGCLPFAAAWAVILVAFAQSAAHAPAFVWAICACLLVLECAFAINHVWPHRTFVRREAVYVLLSPTAKLLLAGLTFGGLRAL